MVALPPGVLAEVVAANPDKNVVVDLAAFANAPLNERGLFKSWIAEYREVVDAEPKMRNIVDHNTFDQYDVISTMERRFTLRIKVDGDTVHVGHCNVFGVVVKVPDGVAVGINDL